MRRSDVLVAGLLTALGLGIIFVGIPAGIPTGAKGDVGLAPDVVPMVLAGLATALSLLLLIKRLPASNAGQSEPAPVPPSSWRFLSIQAAIFAIAFLIFLKFGFAFGAPPLVFVYLLLMGERRAVPIILMSTLVPLFLWLFFWKLLSFPLP